MGAKARSVLGITGLAILAAASPALGQSNKATTYYSGVAELDSSVTVNLGVLDSLGPPPNLLPQGQAPTLTPPSSAMPQAPAAPAPIAPTPTVSRTAPEPAPSSPPRSGLLTGTGVEADPEPGVAARGETSASDLAPTRTATPPPPPELEPLDAPAIPEMAEPVDPVPPAPATADVPPPPPPPVTPPAPEPQAAPETPAVAAAPPAPPEPPTTAPPPPPPAITPPPADNTPAATPPAAAASGAQSSEVAALNSEAVVEQGDQITLLFGPTESELPAGSEPALDRLAERMQADETMRVQLLGYAQEEGGSASQARRLSLFRALSVRTYLIKQGIRSTRMDVRALGNKVEGGNPNRVDIVLPAG